MEAPQVVETEAVGTERKDAVVIRFAGDSGDGMQLTGNQFTTTSALLGNDIATLPDFPAEIRAPAGTVPGVSGFQVQFSSQEIFTPGDEPDVLVAMNAAALKVNLPTLRKGRTVIVNTDGFDAGNLSKAGYENDPARGRHARRLSIDPGRPDNEYPQGPQGVAVAEARQTTLQEFLRVGHHVLALLASA